MARAGRTKAPCPGCKRRARLYSDPQDETKFYAGDRPADGLCRDCEGALDDAKKLVARSERAAKRAADRKPFRVPEMPHWMPYLQHGRHDERDATRVIQSTLKQLAETIADEAVVGAEQDYSDVVPLFTRRAGGGYQSIGYATPVLLEPGIATLLDAIEHAISDYGDVAYAAGRRDGRNLLQALAGGEMTVADYDDRAVEETASSQPASHAALRRENRRRR